MNDNIAIKGTTPLLVKTLQIGVRYAEVQTGRQMRVERKGLLRRKVGVNRRLLDNGGVFTYYEQISDGLLRELTDAEERKLNDNNS